MDIYDRMERWYFYAKANGITLTRMLVHRDDLHSAPSEFMGLPVEGL